MIVMSKYSNVGNRMGRGMDWDRLWDGVKWWHFLDLAWISVGLGDMSL